MPTVDLISLDHAAAQEQISTEQAEELIRRGLFPSPIEVRLSKRSKRRYVPAHELNLRRALVICEADESEIVDRLIASRALRPSLAAACAPSKHEGPKGLIS